MRTRLLFCMLMTIMLFVVASCKDNPAGNSIITGIEVHPSIVAVVRGNTQQFSVVVAGGANTPQNLFWELSGSVNGSNINRQSGFLRVTSNETAKLLEVICRSATNTSQSYTSTVYVADIETPGVFIYPKTDFNGSVIERFHTFVKWTDNQSCSWELFGGVVGTSISPNGELTIGNNETFKDIRIKATSIADPSKWGEVDWYGVTEHTSERSFSDEDITLPIVETRLYPNYPNPFNSTTTISFALARDGAVSLVVYNINGQIVKTIVDDLYRTGHHSVVWNGNDADDMVVEDGIYYVRMLAENYEGNISMVLKRYDIPSFM